MPEYLRHRKSGRVGVIMSQTRRSVGRCQRGLRGFFTVAVGLKGRWTTWSAKFARPATTEEFRQYQRSVPMERRTARS